MMLTARRGAAALIGAALLALDAGGAAAQGAIVRLPERDRALTGTAPQVFAIGKAEGAEHEMFGRIASVAFDASDNLYVVDMQSQRVMMYDRTGRFVRQIGRKGEGPGELMAPVQVGVGGDGTVIVTDMGRPAYSLFRPDGTFIRNVMLRESMPMAFGAPMAWHPQGGVVSVFRQRAPERRQPGQRVQVNPSRPLMFYPLGEGEARRVFEVPSPERVEESTSPGEGGGMNLRIRVAAPAVFSPQILHGVLPDGNVALSFTSGYTVRVVDLNGQTLRYIQRPMRPRATTQADRDRYVAQRRRDIASGNSGFTIMRGGGSGPPPDQIRRMQEQELENLQFADTIPAISGLRVTPSGKMWIARTAQNFGDDGPIDIVTPTGEYLGTQTVVGLPDAISRGGLAAYIEAEDENGVPRVIVRRLPDGWR